MDSFRVLGIFYVDCTDILDILISASRTHYEPSAWRERLFNGDIKLNIATQASGNDNTAIAMVCSAAVAGCKDDDHGIVLIKFVQALAKRQARLDVRLAFDPANVNGPRVLH